MPPARGRSRRADAPLRRRLLRRRSLRRAPLAALGAVLALAAASTLDQLTTSAVARPAGTVAPVARAAARPVAAGSPIGAGRRRPLTKTHPPAPARPAAPIRPGSDPAGRNSAGGSRRCPWASRSALARATPSQLAAEVVSHMTLADELGFVDLVGIPGYENSTVGLPLLCIPPLRLEDGPNGLSSSDTGVTQLPAAIGVAASFDPSLAYAAGALVGDEARRQGIAVVQGPMLNLVRVPEDGRAYETYGEDPFLASALGVADIVGIQSEGVMADAKHLAGYTQESNRHGLDQIISTRQLHELYLAPFRAAVQQAHVASIMCAYGEIDGQPACSDPTLYEALRSWGFEGFVRSDMNALRQPLAAFSHGMDAIKPAASSALLAGIASHRLAESTLDDAVRRLLAEMFRFDLVAHPLTGRTHTEVATPAHAATALSIAEASAVLLLDRHGVLPLRLGRSGSLAVIGNDAAGQAMTSGYGGSRVVAPFVVRPLAALRSRYGAGRVRFASGGTGIAGTVPIPPDQLALDAGSGQPLSPAAAGRAGRGGTTPATLLPPDGKRPLYRIAGTLSPDRSGLYDLAVSSDCSFALLLNGKVVFDSLARHERFTWSSAVGLQARHHYRLELLWRQVGAGTPPGLGWSDVTAAVTAAKDVARSASVAVVFASDFSSEGMDRPGLSLPGDENALISAVAAVNPRTVVVLNTAGPVLMPWIDHVAGVVEAWYPGEQDGAAIAAVLSGRVDPAGRLPVTFPASEGAVPASSPAAWPGVNGVVRYSEGLDIGYRWDQANGVRPLFPFGFGLDYTSFSLSDLRLATPAGPRPASRSVALSVLVRNTGARRGTDVVEGYLGFPRAAAEPPWQLRAFSRVTLAPGRSATVRLVLPASGFANFLHGRWQVAAGRYVIGVGPSSADLPLRLVLEQR